ncbi:restriction endonuclease [Streptomyces cinereoruber]|uniref:restriction endonuclease n=1 Tax=Streptomyces cinereoruber TaxID=67260 RepID=UPI00345D864B
MCRSEASAHPSKALWRSLRNLPDRSPQASNPLITHRISAHSYQSHDSIVVTTAWFGKASWDFAPRNRVELIDGRHLKALLLQHLGIDALIGLPKLPPTWQTPDLS